MTNTHKAEITRMRGEGVSYSKIMQTVKHLYEAHRKISFIELFFPSKQLEILQRVMRTEILGLEEKI